MTAFDPDWVVAPGAILKEWREENGVSVRAFARASRLRPHQVEMIEEGRSEITPAIADHLRYATGISIDFWLSMEKNFRDGLKEGKTWTP